MIVLHKVVVVPFESVRSNGQSTVEFILVLPLLVFLVLAMLQLLWLYFAQQNLYTATSYAVRAAALQGGESSVIERSLASLMTPVQHVIIGASEVEKQRLTSAAVLKNQLHGQLAARVILHQPSTADLAKVQRVHLAGSEWIPNDHLALRYHDSEHPEAEQRVRQLDVEVWWCFRLKIPWAAQFFQQLAGLSNEAAQGFCHTRSTLVGEPLWALQHRLKSPLLSPLQVGAQ